MMKQSTRSLLLFVAIILFVPIVLLQKIIDPGRHQFEPKLKNTNSAMSQLPLEFALGAATGFREAIAGLLWVRTDKFFHEGNYDAIVPMVRIITWLDPHNIDVYQTGAWHLDYNFTDNEQRSDRRYIPYSISLLTEGIQNNPDTSKLYADLAFTHYYRKLTNFGESIKWYETAQNGWADKTIPYWDATLQHDSKGKLVPNKPLDPAALLKGARFPRGVDGAAVIQEAMAIAANNQTWGKWVTDSDPTIVGHGLAHSYQADGQIDKAIAEWLWCMAEHQRFMVEHPDTALQDQQGLSVACKNLYETIQRQKWRLTQTKPPIDFGLTYHVERNDMLKFTVTGKMNIIGAGPGFNLETGAHTFVKQGGCRINIRLEDADYEMPSSVTFDLKTATNLPHDVTVMQDSISVRDDGTYTKVIDLHSDYAGTSGANAMYAFKAKKYRVTLWFDPADPNSAPPSVQDRIGWIGEGMTDKNLDTSGNVPGSAGYHDAGLRQIIKVFYVTKDDLMDHGNKVLLAQ